MHIFLEVGIILAIATVVSIIMRMLKQPLVVGYILSGILVGPYFLNLTQSTEYVELFSKLGITMLLFIVGLSLKPDIIREVGKISLVTGLGQVVFTSVIGFLIMQALGFGTTASIYSAIALTFSSTIIILKLLSDKGDLNKLYGKISIGFLLVQDIVATLILLVVSIWGGANDMSGNTMVFTGILIAKAVLLFVGLYIIGRYILPGLSSFLSKSQELLFLFSITWGLGIAGVFYLGGFSLEIGALAAGVALSVSPFSSEIGSRMKPLRDFFILLFFVMLGSQMIIADISVMIWPAAILSLFVLIGNPIIVIILMNLLGYKSKTGFMAGLTVAQISEFSLILMALGLSFAHIERNIVSLITMVGIITIAGSTYLILYADQIYKALKPVIRFFEFKKHAHHNEKEYHDDFDVVVFGYDRVGYDFIHAIEKIHNKYLVVDFNPTQIKKLAQANIPHVFGDAEDIEFLKEINLPQAKAVISTIPDFKTNLSLVNFYHRNNAEGISIVISPDISHTKELYKAGASFVMMPHYLGAKFASDMIEHNGLTAEAFIKEREKHLQYLAKREKLTD